MATIQLRDIPEEAYETIRSRAHERGMSIQAYVRQCVIENATSPKPEDLARTAPHRRRTRERLAATGAACRTLRRQARGFLRAAGTVVSDRYPHGPMTEAAWGLRENLSYYDALYVALAARLDLPLLTADKRLAAAPGSPAG